MDQDGYIKLIQGDTPKTSLVTLSPIVVQTKAPFKVEVATPFTMMVTPTPSYYSAIFLCNYIAGVRKKKERPKCKR